MSNATMSNVPRCDKCKNCECVTSSFLAMRIDKDLRYKYIDQLARKTQSHSEITNEEKMLILMEYAPMGEANEWVDWVLSSRKRGLCPYR